MISAVLKERVWRFLQGQPALLDFVRQFESIGPVAVFGGLIRDAVLGDLDDFASDIDLVVECDDDALFPKALGNLAHTRNGYGGYSVTFGGWPVDIWPLGATWAIRAGHVVGTNLSILPSTTFLTCNAATLDLTRDHLHVDDRFMAWESDRLLDVNLEPNTNPLGVTVRTLRILAKVPGAHPGPDLVRYLRNSIETLGIDRICAKEARSRKGPAFTRDFVARFA